MADFNHMSSVMRSVQSGLPGGWSIGDRVASTIKHGTTVPGTIGTVLGPYDGTNTSNKSTHILCKFPGMAGNLNINGTSQLRRPRAQPSSIIEKDAARASTKKKKEEKKSPANAARAIGAGALPADQRQLQKEIAEKSYCGLPDDPANAAGAATASIPTNAELKAEPPVVPDAATLARHKTEDQVAYEAALLCDNEAVQQFLGGSYDALRGDDFTQQISDAVDWLISVAPVAPLEPGIDQVVHKLLAVRMFTCSLESQLQWTRLQSAMRAASDAVCTKRLAPLFSKFNLAGGMGTAQIGKLWHYHASAAPGQKPSQAVVAPDFYQLMRKRFNFDDPAEMAEHVCLHAGRAVNLMVNARFQAKMAAAAKRVAGCRYFGVNAKGFARSLVKILNDYALLLPGPGASWVCDGVRCLLTVPSVKAMHALIAILNDEFAGFIQFKNPFELDEAGRAARGHLLLCNITAVFVPENGTFREMLAWPTSGPALEGMMAETATGQPAERWKRHVAASLRLLHEPALADKQVAVAVEIQLTFDYFGVVRNGVHLVYDMVRPRMDCDLWANFGGLGEELPADCMWNVCINGQLSLMDRFLKAPAVEMTVVPEDWWFGFDEQATGVPEGCGGDVNANVGGIGSRRTALFQAAESHHCDVVGYLLKQPGIEVDKATDDGEGRTPLYVSIEKGYGDVAKQLIAAKADVNQARTTDNMTPLHMAVQNGFGDMVKQLIAAKADVNKARTNNGQTPLFTAAQIMHGDVVKQLIAAKADVKKARTSDDATPLFIAAVKGQANVVRQLLDANADVHQATTAETGSYTALKVAKEQSHAEVVAMLITAGAY